jgi:hypothetical protein
MHTKIQWRFWLELPSTSHRRRTIAEAHTGMTQCPSSQEPAAARRDRGRRRSATSACLRLLALLPLFGLLAECGGEARLVVPPTPTAVATATIAATPRPLATPAVTTPTLTAIVWTTAVDPQTGAPADSVSAYPSSSPQLIAAVRVISLPTGAIVKADWSYNNTSLDAFATQVAVDNPTRERWIDFRLERTTENPWPAGTYEIAISLNGASANSSSVEVTGGS